MEKKYGHDQRSAITPSPSTAGETAALTPVVEHSTDLVTWSSDGLELTRSQGSITARETVPSAGGTKFVHLRLSVSQ